MITYRQPFKGDFPITQKYGEFIPGVTVGSAHTGIDYGCPTGTPILASADGTVMAAGWDLTGFGFRVIIRHTADRATLYGHLDSISVDLNQEVRQGDVIGYSGATGKATGPHLHFEARTQWNNYLSHFDPMRLPLMNFADKTEGNPEVTSQNLATASQKLAMLKEPDQLGELVKVVCTDGAKVFNPDWSMRYYGFPQGTKLHFTGKTAKRPGFPQYTYCEVYEEPKKFFVAVHNEDTQILDDQEQ